MEAKNVENITTNFLNFGTYSAENAEILKRELEKKGIPAQVLYPGSNVGRESTARIYFPAYTLLIQGNDFKKAQEIKEKFNIESIKKGEKMPLPRAYTWTQKNKYLSKYFFVGMILSIIAMLFGEELSEFFGISEMTTLLILVGALSICFFGWFFIMLYLVLSKGYKGV